MAALERDFPSLELPNHFAFESKFWVIFGQILPVLAFFPISAPALQGCYAKQSWFGMASVEELWNYLLALFPPPLAFRIRMSGGIYPGEFLRMSFCRHKIPSAINLKIFYLLILRCSLEKNLFARFHKKSCSKCPQKF